MGSGGQGVGGYGVGRGGPAGASGRLGSAGLGPGCTAGPTHKGPEPELLCDGAAFPAVPPPARDRNILGASRSAWAVGRGRSGAASCQPVLGARAHVLVPVVLLPSGRSRGWGHRSVTSSGEVCGSRCWQVTPRASAGRGAVWGAEWGTEQGAEQGASGGWCGVQSGRAVQGAVPGVEGQLRAPSSGYIMEELLLFIFFCLSKKKRSLWTYSFLVPDCGILVHVGLGFSGGGAVPSPGAMAASGLCRGVGGGEWQGRRSRWAGREELRAGVRPCWPRRGDHWKAGGGERVLGPWA